MKSLKIEEIVTLIMPLIGNENHKSVTAFMYQVRGGQRRLPPEWEPHLLAILECNKEELCKAWSKIRFKGEKRKENRKLRENIHLKVEINIQKSEPVILEKDNLEELISAFRVFKSFGFSIEMTMQPIV